MRVIVVSPALPLPFGRADARWLVVLLSELARRNIDVTCVSCTEDQEASVTEASILARDRGIELVHVPLTLDETPLARKAHSLWRPFSELRRCEELQRVLEQVTARPYDVLHIEHLFTAWIRSHDPRSVVYLHHLEVIDWEGRDDLSLRERQLLLQMRRATRTLLRRSRRVIVASRRLLREVAALEPRVAPIVVPVALDLDLYPLVTGRIEPVVGVIGSMHWYPSRAAAVRVLTRLWPRILAQVPEARLLVAGRRSEHYLGPLFPIDAAELTGDVQHPADFFSNVAVLLYPPPKGTGMKIKVLEALAYGVPVVSNTEGLEGILERGPHGVVPAETDIELIAATVQLLRDSVERERLRLAGRAFVEREHSAAPAVDRLLTAYAALGLVP